MPRKLPGTTIHCPDCAKELTVPDDDHVLAAGTMLGAFEILDLIGTGGMGHVYLARDTATDRQVALKVLANVFCDDATMRRRFLNEMRLLAALEHPNIVTVFGAGEDGSHTFLSMAFVKGVALDERLEEVGQPLEEAEVLRIAAEIAKGLDYAFRKKGILHRDIKPANVMLAKNQVKILDLGIARRATRRTDVTEKGLAIGTPQYMSPEQAMAKEVDCRSDMYALGVTMYHLLTGRCPHDGGSPAEVMTRVVSDDLPPIRTIRPDLSIGCERFLQQITARPPEARHDSWREVRIELERIRTQQVAEVPDSADSAPPARLGLVITGLLLLTLALYAASRLL